MGCRLSRELNRALHSARKRDVIVLYQHAVIQTESMIEPAADSHRIFLKKPEPGSGLASVGDARSSSLNASDECASQRCDAGQPLHDIERSALAGQKRRRRAFYFRELVTGRDIVAVVNARFEADRIIERAEDRFGDFESAKDKILFGEEPSSRSQPTAHDALRGYVAAPQIFLQEIRGKCVDDSWIEFHLVRYPLTPKRTKRGP